MAEKDRTTDTGTERSDTPVTEQSGKRNTRTRTTKDGGSGTGSGTGSGNNNSGTGKTEEKRIPELATVKTEEIPKPELKKPRKPRKKKTVKKNDENFNADQITAILLTVSSIASMSERGRIFALSEIEARQLSEPIAKLIANNDSMKAVAEHSDSVALMITAFMIFTPKIIMWLQYEKAHKKPKGVSVKTIKGVKTDEGKTSGSDRRNDSTNAHVNTNDVKNIDAFIPSVM